MMRSYSASIEPCASPNPVGARSATVTLSFTLATPGSNNNAYADNLSLVLNTPAAANTFLGRNVVVNGDAEVTLRVPPPLDTPLRVDGLNVYDGQTLAHALTAAGFVDAEEHAIGRSETPELAGLEAHGQTIPAEFNELETIVLEARRP